MAIGLQHAFITVIVFQLPFITKIIEYQPIQFTPQTTVCKNGFKEVGKTRDTLISEIGQ
jgi:hypothetical protein